MVTIPRAMFVSLIESRMVDTCVVTRDVKGVFDAVLNESTGELESSVQDSTIYTGDCLIGMINAGDKELKNAGMEYDYNTYKALLPRNSTTYLIRAGDTLTLTYSKNLPDRVGSSYRVSHVEDATHPVYLRILIQDKSESLGTPAL